MIKKGEKEILRYPPQFTIQPNGPDWMWISAKRPKKKPPTTSNHKFKQKSYDKKLLDQETKDQKI